ncbi:MAG: Uncharacterised protein [Opitutia bacterium UBA7350]|nr:MAG: Uncharacterised protein [Opitutae bacterium UBA7350]
MYKPKTRKLKTKKRFYTFFTVSIMILTPSCVLRLINNFYGNEK